MEIGIGLPNHIAHVRGPVIIEWAQRAQHRGFATVATCDRLVYPSLDSIVALSLAAGATSDIGLVTNVLLAPIYPAALVAKQTASLADAAGNRLTLALAAGARPDDFTATGADFHHRGHVFDQTLELMRHAWRAEEHTDDTALSPAPVQIPVLFGGTSQPTIRRVSTAGDGWASGALRDYPQESSFADRVRTAWQKAGRPGTPRLMTSVNFAFGDQDTVSTGHKHLRDYYGGFSSDYAELNVADMLTSPADAIATVRAYRDLGFDMLLLHPTVGRLDQVDRLADALL